MPDRPVRKPRGGEGKPDLETVLAQFYIAFGQGAGSLFVQPDCIAAVRTEFEKKIWPNIRQWDAAALSALEYVRTVGRVCAFRAIAEGTNLISARHLAEALAMVGKNAVGPFLICECLV
jgi:hypothetical protein